MRNEGTLAAIEAELQRNCGDELAAAQAVGVSLKFVYQWRKDDRAVDERLTEASRVGKQGLISAAIQRAVHGVQKGVYFKGVRVDEETVYSDGLLQTLLKAQVPEFAKDGEGAGVNVQVNIANLMPRAKTYDQWLEMKNQTFALPTPQPTLEDASDFMKMAMSPPDEVEAEFVPVDPFGGIVL